MSRTDLQSESRPLLTSRPEKILQVGCRNADDFLRMPNGHLVVVGNCCRRENSKGRRVSKRRSSTDLLSHCDLNPRFSTTRDRQRRFPQIADKQQ